MSFSLATFQQSFELAGYQRHDIPLIEPAALFQTKGGERVIERMLTFRHGNTEFALRPEFTASAAREFALSGQEAARWQFCGPVFGVSHNGNHTFYGLQLGAELLGRRGALADAELIATALDGLQEAGIHDVSISIGHAGLTRLLLQEFGLEDSLNQFLMTLRPVLLEAMPDALESAMAAVERYLGGWSSAEATPGNPNEVVAAVLAIPERGTALGGRTREAIAERLALKRHRAANQPIVREALRFLLAWLGLRGTSQSVLDAAEHYCHSATTRNVLDEWRATVALLAAHDVPAERITLVPGLDRVWDYYSGVVFNLSTSAGVVIGGGGRYDGLVKLIAGGVDSPAVGFGLDADLIESLYGHPSVSERRELQIMPVSRGDSAEAIRWAALLRKHGITCIVESVHSAHPENVLTVSSGSVSFRNVDYVANIGNVDSTLIHILKAGFAS